MRAQVAPQNGFVKEFNIKIDMTKIMSCLFMLSHQPPL